MATDRAAKLYCILRDANALVSETGDSGLAAQIVTRSNEIRLAYGVPQQRTELGLLLRDCFAAKRGIVKARPFPSTPPPTGPWVLSWPQFEAIIGVFSEPKSSVEACVANLVDPRMPLPSQPPRYVRRFCHFFERCGCVRFAEEMALTVATDLQAVKAAIDTFTLAEAVEAAGFHGDIGESAATLDAMAKGEQSEALTAEAAVRTELRALGATYLDRHGIKFLVSAKGKTAPEMLAILKGRLSNPSEVELHNAKEALWEITAKRLDAEPADTVCHDVAMLLKKHGVAGASICSALPTGAPQTITFGDSIRGKRAANPDCFFEIASLSKSIGSAFAIQYFGNRGIPIESSVNSVLSECGSPFRLTHKTWGDKVQLVHLMSHCALNMHYVNGIPLNEKMLDVLQLIQGNERYGYPPVDVVHEPGTKFQYSGGGFLVLQHIIEAFENKPIWSLIDPFLRELHLESSITFDPVAPGFPVAHGYGDDGKEVVGTRKMFPAFAAGAYATSSGMLGFLRALQAGYEGDRSGAITPSTARLMLTGTDKGCREFMGVLMGVGIFVGEAGPNRFAIHQGANDGFRSVFLSCFEGPDAGAGVVIFANGDNRAMFFVAEALQRILLELNVEGVDFSKFMNQEVSVDSVPPEEIVNYGYKNLVFAAFRPKL